ncbi:helix-hairpin-helix domain-containing protein [Ureibacillus sp. FSL K6-8385]|uniref:ComEA protein n=1 Tax=Ureibacillus terrenus TaxID=118246 RepID=A0A540V4X7_9BACL|nr:helix-hairpin-helix domain-containing protein [Ureibacillus terrenus]MED3661501.1 helix-hairpin-helix domain-containing protein [Ureibacillus terrenus]MED3763968.1 helix-hairpin-helix domain-containing protein [Ureibacillus terrenus]TQE91810.1 comEA protein [Ureibacillus terrenus]
MIFQDFLKKYGKILAAPGILCLIIGIYLFLQQDHSDEAELISTIPQEPALTDNETLQTEETSSTKVVVDVKGAVKFPGVYELTNEDRIIDAIQLAGGYLEEADSKYINHAQKLQDEMVIYIPKKGETPDVEGQRSIGQVFTQTQPSGGKETLVNINTADESQLTTLPGIGPSKAKAIIQYREEHGKFKHIEDIKNVSGIGEKTFEKLKDLITV